MTGTNIWDNVLSRIETKVNRHSFYTWFKPTGFVAEADHPASGCRTRVPGLADQALCGILDEALVARCERPGSRWSSSPDGRRTAEVMSADGHRPGDPS
jgi:hypothetical protein